MTITPSDVHQKIRELTAEGAYFALQQVDVDGRPATAFRNAPGTLLDVLKAGRGHGGAPFVVYEGRTLSFDQFYRRADALATTLQRVCGIKPGDRVAIAMRNSPDWSVAYVAGALIGAVLAPLNSWGKAADLLYGIDDSGARMLICDRERYDLLEDRLQPRQLEVVVATEDALPERAGVRSLEQAVAAGQSCDYRAAEAGPMDIAQILYTSGSTGFPKGVSTRHIAICQSLANMLFLGMLAQSLGKQRAPVDGKTGETPLLTVPLFHATGLVAGLLLPLLLGQKVVMMYKWDTRAALELIAREKVTGITTVPTVLQALLTHPDFERHDTRSLFRVSAAGAATPTGLAELIGTRIEGAVRSTGWGMTETMAVGATMIGPIYDLNPASAGIPSPLAELRFVDVEGRELPAGQAGEIQYRGVTLCAGYWNKPDATREALDHDWFRTGDVGYLDVDGYLHITDRIKDIVIRGGENIYPGEIESAAYAMGTLQDVVVFGVPDTAMGEELALVACPLPGVQVDVEQLRAHLATSLARYKVPRYLELTTEPLPQNASGKLFKRQIQKDFVARHKL